ncbi:MAG TPA: glycosyltransferase [Stellaceae bacterium]|jgi:glycosyltransferase involved in cell wall biosynthesis
MNRTGAPDRVVVINDDAVERGGAAAIALASARLIAERGIPVTFLSGSGEAEADLAARGIGTVWLGGRQLLARGRAPAFLRGLHDPATNAALVDWIEANDTSRTVYHLHNWHKALSPSVFDGLGRVASRLVVHAHDFFLSCPNGAYFHYPRQHECGLVPNGVRCLATSCDRRHYTHKLWRAGRHALRHRRLDLTTSAARVVALHETMVPLLARGPIAASRIRVLHNPVTPWRKTRVPVETNSDLFFVGRLDGDKGAQLLARAAERIGVGLRVIGDGPLAPEITRLCPRADLLGWRRRTEIGELVAGARVVVSPTVSREPFGLVALEALMSGIPVIVAKNSPFADEITKQGLGLACDPHDEEALAGAIAALAYDDLLVRRMSQRAMTEARRLAPTPAQWCGSLLSLYAECLGDPAGLPDIGEAADG